MVALHNRKLTAKDIFPDLIWTDEDFHRKQDEFRAELIAEGHPNDPMIIFALSRRMEAYQQRFPKLSERQKIMNRIYPPVVRKSSLFTDEELHWLAQHLGGANDPIGRDILEKVERLIRG